MNKSIIDVNKTEIEDKINVKSRQSGIELLKIVAMMGIIMCHCCVSIRTENSPFLQYFDINKPTTDVTFFISQMIYYLGMLGNMIFFISSAWFLIDSNKMKLNKIVDLLSDNYVFSVIILLIFLGGGKPFSY